MENAEEILQRLDEFSKHKPKTIPKELEDYLCFVARTGDPVYQWAHIKSLFKEKLLSVITDFYETSPGIDIPQCPNVDPFNYDVMKNSLVERIDGFASAPFTVQRISELLTTPRKNYNRIDKFMRAVEKNILVVSTREPGPRRHSESESGEHVDSIVNGSENSEYSVDVEMEDISNWKEGSYQSQERAQQASSSDMAMNVDNTPITDKIEELTETEITEKAVDAEAKAVEIGCHSESPHIVQSAESDCGREICSTNSSESLIEIASNVSESSGIQPSASEFLVDAGESKSPVQPETDPLAIEEPCLEESASNKLSDTTTLTDDTIIKPSVPLEETLLKNEPQKEAIQTSEMQVDTLNTESASSEAPFDGSSVPSHSANTETSSEDNIKSEIMSNENIAASQNAEAVPRSEVISAEVPVENAAEDTAVIKDGTIESIADVIDTSSDLQTNVKESSDIHEDSKEAVEASREGVHEERVSVPTSESVTDVLNTADASVE